MPDLLYAARHLSRRQVDGHAEGLQDVGAAAAAAGRAVTVLGHLHAGAGSHQRRGGGDVECARPIPAGAAGVEDHIGVHLDLLGQLGHGPRQADDLRGRLAFHAQGAEEGGRLHIGDAAAHDLEQDAARLLGRQVPPCGQRS